MAYLKSRGLHIRRSFQVDPEGTLERIMLNYITTNRSLRELSEYYGIPKSTLHYWINKIGWHKSSYASYDQYKNTAKLHKRKLYTPYEEYIKLDEDGPLD